MGKSSRLCPTTLNMSLRCHGTPPSRYLPPGPLTKPSRFTTRGTGKSSRLCQTTLVLSGRCHGTPPSRSLPPGPMIKLSVFTTPPTFDLNQLVLDIYPLVFNKVYIEV